MNNASKIFRTFFQHQFFFYVQLIEEYFFCCRLLYIRLSTLVPFHLPHSINHASVSAKMAAILVTQWSCCLCSAKTRPRLQQQQIRIEPSQHLVPVHPRFCFLGGKQHSWTPPIQTCQLDWRLPHAQCQLCLEFQDSLLKGRPSRFAPFTKCISHTNSVPGPYCKLRTKRFSSLIYGPSAKQEFKRKARTCNHCLGHETSLFTYM